MADLVVGVDEEEIIAVCFEGADVAGVAGTGAFGCVDDTQVGQAIGHLEDGRCRAIGRSDSNRLLARNGIGLCGERRELVTDEMCTRSWPE